MMNVHSVIEVNFCGCIDSMMLPICCLLVKRLVIVNMLIFFEGLFNLKMDNYISGAIVYQ